MSVQQVETTSGRLARGLTPARRVAQLRRLLLGQVSDEDARAIMNKLLELAREGNLQAVKLVLAYTVGKPGPVHLFEDPYEAPPPPRATQGTHVPRSPAPTPPDLMRQIEDAIKLPHSLVNLAPATVPTAAGGRR